MNWTAAARAQLRDIHALVARSSPEYAMRLVDRLTRRSKQIASFPYSGRIVPDVNDVNVREVVEGRYRIIYHVIGDAVDVVAVVHGARHWPEERDDDAVDP